MKTIRVMDSSGDSVINFNEADAKAKAEAQELFAKLLGAGGTAFKVNRANGKPDEKVVDFRALENETIIIPRIVGG